MAFVYPYVMFLSSCVHLLSRSYDYRCCQVEDPAVHALVAQLGWPLPHVRLWSRCRVVGTADSDRFGIMYGAGQFV